MSRDDEFELYDLMVVVEAIEGDCTCSMRVGDRFFLRGGRLSLPDGTGFCLYALQAVIPLLPAKQRKSHPADWIETDTRAACPDPACRLIMRIGPQRHAYAPPRRRQRNPMALGTAIGRYIGRRTADAPQGHSLRPSVAHWRYAVAGRHG